MCFSFHSLHWLFLCLYSLPFFAFRFIRFLRCLSVLTSSAYCKSPALINQLANYDALLLNNKYFGSRSVGKTSYSRIVASKDLNHFILWPVHAWNIDRPILRQSFCILIKIVCITYRKRFTYLPRINLFSDVLFFHLQIFLSFLLYFP